MLTMISGILISSVTRQGKYLKGAEGWGLWIKGGHGVWSLLRRMLWMRGVGVNGKIKGKRNG